MTSVLSRPIFLPRVCTLVHAFHYYRPCGCPAYVCVSVRIQFSATACIYTPKYIYIYIYIYFFFIIIFFTVYKFVIDRQW